jgi:hypothetical protein
MTTENSNKVPGVNLETRLKCPKGTNMAKRTKTIGALLGFASHADRKQYMKLLAKTQHEADVQAKSMKRPSSGGGGFTGGQPKDAPPPGTRTLRAGEVSVAAD